MRLFRLIPRMAREAKRWADITLQDELHEREDSISKVRA
jgi:hypothetical protein